MQYVSSSNLAHCSDAMWLDGSIQAKCRGRMNTLAMLTYGCEVCIEGGACAANSCSHICLCLAAHWVGKLGLALA